MLFTRFIINLCMLLALKHPLLLAVCRLVNPFYKTGFYWTGHHLLSDKVYATAYHQLVGAKSLITRNAKWTFTLRYSHEFDHGIICVYWHAWMHSVICVFPKVFSFPRGQQVGETLQEFSHALMCFTDWKRRRPFMFYQIRMCFIEINLFNIFSDCFIRRELKHFVWGHPAGCTATAGLVTSPWALSSP